MARTGYKPEPLPAIIGGRCTKHDEKTSPSGICMSCHHDALDAAGFNWREISGLRSDMGGATGFNRARLES